MFSHSFWKGIASIIGIVCCTGCNPPPAGETVLGMVTIQGMPMKEGLITFQPIDATKGPKISTVIENGRYKITSEDGIHAGNFRVEILGIPPGVKAMAEGRHGSELFRHDEARLQKAAKTTYREVAAEFNFQSHLRARLQAGIENRQDFQVDYASSE